MAFSDIKHWAQLMESQEQEKKAYDEACEACEKQAKELDEKELNDLDEEKIDPETFAETEFEEKEELADVEAEDEAVDFDSYRLDEDGICCICQRPYRGYGNNADPVAHGKCCDMCNQSVVIPARMQQSMEDKMAAGELPELNEADRREPLTMIASALNKIASSANLTKQDSVMLNESSDFMTVEEAKDFIKKFVVSNIKDVEIQVKFVGSNTYSDFEVDCNSKKQLVFNKGHRSSVVFSYVVQQIIQHGNCKWNDIIDFVWKDNNETYKFVRAYPDEMRSVVSGSVPTIVFQFEKPQSKKYGDFFDSDTEKTEGRPLDEGDEEGKKSEGTDDVELKEAAAAPTDAGWLAWVGGEDKIADWSDTDKAQSKKLFADLVKKGHVDGVTGKNPNEKKFPDFPKTNRQTTPPPAEVIDRTEEMKEDPDYPLTDEDWDEIDSLDSVEDKVNAIKNLSDFEHLEGKVKQEIQDDIDFIQSMAKKKAESEKYFKRAAQIQKTSFKRELTDVEIKEFADILNTKLDDFQKAVLFDLPEKNGYGEVHTITVPKGGAQASHGAAHTGEDADERTMETGTDQTFTADNWLNMDDPMAPGEKIQVQFDPKYVSMVDQRADLRHEISKLSKVTEPYYKDVILPQKKLEQARQIVTGKHPQGGLTKDGDITPDAWKYIRDQLDPQEAATLRDELKSGAGTQAEKDYADWLFGDLKVTQKMMAALQGMGGDQEGETGANTQQGTKMQDFILAQLALYLNVANDEADRMLDIYRKEGVVSAAAGSNGAKYLDREKTHPNPNSARMVREQLRGPLFEAILEENGFTAEQIKQIMGLDTTPDPNGGPKAMKAAQKVIGMILQKSLVEMTPEEFDNFKQAFATYQTKGEVRKFRTGLTNQQNTEYQNLLHQMRADFDAIPEDQKRRFVVLDKMRHGYDQIQAEAYADRVFGELNGKPITLDNFVKTVGKDFLRGGSGNVTKDTITLRNAEAER